MDKASRKAIDGVSAAATIGAMCAALERCLAILEFSCANTAGFADALKDVLWKRAEECRRGLNAYTAAGRYACNVKIYCDLTACLVFAGFRICQCRDAQGLREQVEFIVDFFSKCMTRPRSTVLSPGRAGDLLSLVEEKYGMLSAVTYERELEIYLINRSHISYDSFLLTYKNTHTGIWLNKWLLFSLSPRFDIPECNECHVFIHELGHILYNAVTGGGETVPRMFGEIAFLLGIPLGEDMNCRDEIFADLFSAATLNGSRYSSFNPFGRVLGKEMYELLELYFRMLVNDAGRDFYNRSGLSGMLH